MHQPLVSIIISAYNSEKWLADCLQSALGQSVTDIEVIAVDDCSTDGSLAVMRSFADKDNRLKILVNEKNRGQAAGLNRGIDISTGRWLAFFDADDLLDPDFCKILLAEAEKSGADIIKGRARYIELDGTVHETPLQWQRDISKKSPLCFHESLWTAIFRAEKIRGKIRFHEGAPIAVDILFLAEVLSFPLSVTCCEDIVYIHILRENSVGEYRNRSIKKIKACLDARVRILRLFNERHVDKTDRYGYRIWAKEALRNLGSFHRAREGEREAALKLCAARAPEIASLIRCDYPGLKKYLMPLVLKILTDDRLMFARVVMFRCYGLWKKFRPPKGH